jgi:peptidoglycan/LPS O-acetylase OafA/YrhL
VENKIKIDWNNLNNFKYYKNLDILRSIAVLLVFICHLIVIYNPNLLTTGLTYKTRDGAVEKFFNLQSLGLIGVLIFFVHTSFVLMHSLQSKYLSLKLNFFSFYIQRIFRIYPLSIFIVISYLFISHQNEFSIKLFISNIFLIQNLVYFNDLPGEKSTPGILWTLPYEMQFYVFLPFIFIICKNYSNRIIFLYMFSIIFVLIHKYFNTPFFNIFKYFPCFLSGVLGYIFKGKIKLRFFFLLLFIIFSIVLFPLLVAKNIAPSNLISIFFCFILGLLISNTEEVKNKFVNIICKQIAKYSYGIYIFHIFAISLFVQMKIFILFKIILSIVTLCIISIIGYHIIESPMIKVGKKLSNKLKF